jgi:regulator of protease activity HflC (stomatin/prohibitin superfamily)
MRRLAARSFLALLLGLTVFVYFIPEVFITVGPGEAAVHWRRFFGGTVTDHVRGEGLQVILPWDELYIYDVRVQETERSLPILTSEGLSATAVISIRYQPDRNLLGKLHQRVGPDYAAKVVIPEVEGAVRKALGGLDSESLYTRSRDLIQNSVAEVSESLAQNFIQIDDVVIQRIILPEVLQDAVIEKAKQQQVAESYVYRLQAAQSEAARLKIEAEGFAEYNNTISKTLTPNLLTWEGVRATKDIATSENSKVIIMGNGKDGLPVILNSD